MNLTIARERTPEGLAEFQRQCQEVVCHGSFITRCELVAEDRMVIGVDGHAVVVSLCRFHADRWIDLAGSLQAPAKQVAAQG